MSSSPAPRPVTIIVLEDGNVTIQPTRRTIQRDNQRIVWTLVAGSTGWNWSTNPPGIVCRTDPPTSFYTAWPGQAATLDATTNKYHADAGRPVDRPEFYKYDINLKKGEEIVRIDPDIENQPQPF